MGYCTGIGWWYFGGSGSVEKETRLVYAVALAGEGSR